MLSEVLISMDSLVIYFGSDSYGYNLILIRLLVYLSKINILLLLEHFHFSWVVVLLLVMLMLLVLKLLVFGRIVLLTNMHLVQNFQESFSQRFYHMMCILPFCRTMLLAFPTQR